MLIETIDLYKQKFHKKIHINNESDSDVLMKALGVTPEQKLHNRQYWGRELGMCWQRLIIEVCQTTRKDFKPALRFGNDEPCDLLIGNIAIDTKYRIGSGDSGTHKKFRNYATQLITHGFKPLMLILREDNLPGAIHSCTQGGWKILTGDASFDFIKQQTKIDLKEYLQVLSLQ